MFPTEPKTITKPTRPRTAYNFFFHQERQRIQEEILHNTGRGPAYTIVSKIVASRWKVISASENAYFQSLAIRDKARYGIELVEYKNHHKQVEHKTGNYSRCCPNTHGHTTKTYTTTADDFTLVGVRQVEHSSALTFHHQESTQEDQLQQNLPPSLYNQLVEVSRQPETAQLIIRFLLQNGKPMNPQGSQELNNDAIDGELTNWIPGELSKMDMILNFLKVLSTSVPRNHIIIHSFRFCILGVLQILFVFS